MKPDNSVEIIQHWNHGEAMRCPPTPESLFAAAPRIGVVIGTFAALPYIHLQLEARRRLYPDIPLLVHDDGSLQADRIASLCKSYGCDFESNNTRQPPYVGDLTAFVGGLAWAQSTGLDILVKFSRRWLFLTDWATSLRALALESQYATFCSYTTSFNFGFRTECIGLAVAKWGCAEIVEDLWGSIRRPREMLVEGYLHEFARRLERHNCPRAERWREAHPMPDHRSGYALWTLMGTDRCERSPYYLWHNFAKCAEYQRQASEWGLNYSVADFEDPNQGAGIQAVPITSSNSPQ
jgi:hypothetical protein